MNTKKWKMRDGTKIRIKDMADTHIINTLAMLRRLHMKNLNSLWGLASIIQGEIASDDLESCIMESEEEGPSVSFPIYDDLEEEATRRNFYKKRRKQ